MQDYKIKLLFISQTLSNIYFLFNASIVSDALNIVMKLWGSQLVHPLMDNACQSPSLKAANQPDLPSLF